MKSQRFMGGGLALILLCLTQQTGSGQCGLGRKFRHVFNASGRYFKECQVNDMENNFTEIGSHDFSYGQIIFVVLMFESRPQFTQSLVSV